MEGKTGQTFCKIDGIPIQRTQHQETEMVRILPNFDSAPARCSLLEHAAPATANRAYGFIWFWERIRISAKTGG